MEGLKNKADFFIPDARQLIFIQIADIAPLKKELAGS